MIIKSVDANFDCCTRYYFFGKHTAKCRKVNGFELETDPKEVKGLVTDNPQVINSGDNKNPQ